MLLINFVLTAHIRLNFYIFLFQLSAVPESFAYSARYLVISVGVWVEGYSAQQVYIHLAVLQYLLISRYRHDLAYYSKTCLIALIFDEFTFQYNGEFVDYGGINTL